MVKSELKQQSHFPWHLSERARANLSVFLDTTFSLLLSGLFIRNLLEGEVSTLYTKYLHKVDPSFAILLISAMFFSISKCVNGQ